MRSLTTSFILALSLILVSCANPPAIIAIPIDAAFKPIAVSGALAMLKREEEKAAKFVSVDTLKPIAATPTSGESAQRSSVLQSLATARNFAGDDVGAIAAHDAGFTGRSSATLSESERALIAESTAEDALQAIVAAAKSRQIVILNEAHHVAMNRAFAMRLARELRKLGFEYLACEGFTNAIALSGYTGPLPKPLEKGYPAINTGFYVRDPYFGQFLRETIQDGWKFVAYEHIESDRDVPGIERVRRREEGQANNLIERILRNDPTAKVFIYAGYAHAAKVALPFNGGKQE